MKTIKQQLFLLTLSVLTLLALNRPALALEPGDYDMYLLHAGILRVYELHIPPSYDQTKPTPLVFAFHGGGGYYKTMANDKFYKWKSKSDKEGFLVVFPNGTSPWPSGKLATWNAGECCGYARDNNIDDVGFVKAMVDDLNQKVTLDPAKIFATGFSNGGMLAYRLACEIPDVIKAIASVAGTDNYPECNPQKRISILHIHALDDDHVLFEGGMGPAVKNPAVVTEYTSVPKTISLWLRRDNCTTTPQKALEVEGAYCDLYPVCRNEVTVELCVTEEGGHSWPGGVSPIPTKSPPSTAIDATDTIWDFFKAQK